jgi:hypothetical protein
LVAANARLIERDSTVSRVLAQNAAKKQFKDIAAGHVATSNMAAPGTTKTYDTEIRDVSSKILSDYPGNPGNRALLTQFLDTATNEASRRFNGLYIDASKSLLDTQVTSGNSAAAAFAAKTGNLEEGLMQVRLLAEDLADARTSAETDADIRAGSAGVYQAIFNTLTKGKDWVSARELLDDPELTGFIDGPTMQKMRNTVLVGEREVEAGADEARQDLSYTATILGISKASVKREHLVLAKILAKTELTLQEKFDQADALMVRITGKSMSEAQAARFLRIGVDTDPRSFDRKGSMKIATDTAPSIIDGSATEAEKNDFIAAMAVLTLPFTRIVDGLPTPFEAKPTALQQEALDAMGVGSRGFPVKGSPPADGGGTGGSPGAAHATGAEPNDDITTVSYSEKHTLWNSLGLGTGPMSAAWDLVGKIPGLGDLLPQDQTTIARVQLERGSRLLVSALRETNKSQIEMQELTDKLAIEPTMWTSQSRARAVFVGLAISLEKTIRTDRMALLTPGKIGKQHRDKLKRFVQQAEAFLENLGLPEQFKGHGDAFKAYREGGLAPGAEYRVVGETVVFVAPKAAFVKTGASGG